VSLFVGFGVGCWVSLFVGIFVGLGLLFGFRVGRLVGSSERSGGEMVTRVVGRGANITLLGIHPMSSHIQSMVVIQISLLVTLKHSSASTA